MNTRGVILFYLARKNCATLDEICKNTRVSEGNAKVVLSRLAKEHYITRRWLRAPGGKKVRLYCVNTTKLKEMNV